MHVRANPLPLLLALSLAACAARPAPATEPQVVAPAPGDGQAGGGARRETPLQGEPAQAVEAIRRGDLEGARTILSRVLFARHMADAGAKLELGQPEAALLDTEAALELFPREQDALLLDARGRLALAEALLAGGRPFAREALEDARAASLHAGASAAARLGAARASYLLGDSAAALTYAREGMAAPDLGQAAVDRSPQRTYAEAAYAAYVAQRAALEPGAPGQPAPSELFKETETALASYLGRATGDPWVYATLASLYEAEGLLMKARDTLLLGVASAPRDRSLVEHLADVARRAEGDAGALATFETLAKAHRELPEVHWYEGYLRFQLALAALGKKELEPAAFRAAEASFARCRGLAPDYADNCVQYELLCRDALGWCLLEAGDVDGAHAAFLSMEELKEGGLEQQLEGQLGSGVTGLALCAKAFYDRGDFLQAGDASERLRGYRPAEVAYANNAGFFLREAALKIADEGEKLCRAARGEVHSPDALADARKAAELDPGIVTGSLEEREALRAAADGRMARARVLMGRSAEAYRAAAELAPEDVRIVNDAALVHVHYLRTDLERARADLERCVELGERQVQGTGLDKDALLALKNAWGDAHENLGVLHAFLGDKAQAIHDFEQAVAIGPDPRPIVTEAWLPFLRGEKVGLSDDLLAPWGEPCR